MFNKFKEKLKSWFKSSKEKIEETVIAEAKKEESEDEIDEKKLEKIEQLIEEVKEETQEEIPTSFDISKGLRPDLEKIKDKGEKLKKELETAKKIEKEKKHEEKEIQKFELALELAKNKEISEVPLKFEVGKLKHEPDLEQIKELEKIEEKEKEGFFTRLKSKFSHKLTEEEFNKIFDELEMLLLENNVALEAVEKIKEKLSKLIGKEIKKNEIELIIKNELKKVLNDILIEPDNPLDFIKNAKKPFKILFFGINGVGKTTVIAKIASFLKKSGFSVVLAAGDTFRAASIEQLSEHAEKLGVKVVRQDYGTDPAAVAFDAIKYAEKHKIDIVLIDTAGRMHTKTNLLSEMEKIVRVTKPNLKLFVGESIAGNDAIEQARTFNNKVGIDGIILSKVDVDEKGGTIISVSYATNKPIFYLGTGQNYDDLELFNKQKFVENLVGN